MTYRDNVFYPKTETALSPSELLALKHRYEDFDAQTELTKIARHFLGRKVVKHSQIIAWGLDHLLYRVTLDDGKDYVFRLNNTTVEDQYFLVEKLIYDTLIRQKVQNCQVKVAELRSEGNFPYDVLIMDALKTADFEKQLQDHQYTYPQELEMVYKTGVFLRSLHNIKTDKFGFFDIEQAKAGKLVGTKNTWADYFDTAFIDNLRRTYDLGYADKALIARTEKVLAKYHHLLDHVTPVLLHGDFCDHNMIVHGATITGVIDLTDALSGDYLHDIAFWLSFYSFDRLNFLTKGYFAPADNINRENFMDKLYLYLLRINYSKAILRHQYGIADRIPLAIDKIMQSLQYLEKD